MRHSFFWPHTGNIETELFHFLYNVRVQLQPSKKEKLELILLAPQGSASYGCNASLMEQSLPTIEKQSFAILLQVRTKLIPFAAILNRLNENSEDIVISLQNL